MSGSSHGFGSSLVKGKWKVVRKIGQGAFGEIFQARHITSAEEVAIKVERVDSKKQVLKLEVAVLKKLAGCSWVVQLITCGRHGDFNYMVMELLGENISEFRRRQPDGRFSLTTTMKLGMQMLRAIEAVHDLGYLHRDVKPSNFAMGLKKPRQVFLLDFGLARRYLLPSGKVRPPREQSGFRGTARYASIHSHMAQDLARRDDLWSLLYVLIEFANGQLPWRRIKDKDHVGEMKMRCDTPELVSGLPEEYLIFMTHLKRLTYEERPDYDFFYELMERVYVRYGGTERTPFDWEAVPEEQKTHVRPLPSLVDLALNQVVTGVALYSYVSLPSSIKLRLLQRLTRLRRGHVPRQILMRLLDSTTKRLDLSTLKGLETEDLLLIFKTCSRLSHLVLPPAVTDSLLKLVLPDMGCAALQELRLQAHSKQLTSKGLKLVSDACPQLRVVALTGAEKVSDRAVEYLLKRCVRVEELSLAGCKKIKGTFLKPWLKPHVKVPLALTSLDLSYCELSKIGFKCVVRACSSLVSLTFAPLTTAFKITSADFLHVIHRAKSLTALNLKNYHFEMDAILIEISKACQRMSTLLLDGIGMTDFGLQYIVQNCSDLKRLGFQYGDGVSDVSLHQIAKCCAGLESLSLDFWNKFNRHSVNDHSIRNVLAHCTSLREVSMHNCLMLTGQCFPESVLHHVTRMELNDCVQLNDFAIQRVSHAFPFLQHLSLDGLNNLTELALSSLAVGCALLQTLSLRNCACFTDEDMVKLVTKIPQLLLRVTRYGNVELKGVTVEVHRSTIHTLFKEFPNTFRVKALEKTRKRPH